MQKSNNILSNPYKTSITITAGFLLLFFIFKANWMLYVAFAVSLAASLSPYLGKMIAVIWDKIGWLLGLILPKILLSLIFFFILWPISQLSKLTRKDPLLLRHNGNSTFQKIERTIDAKQFEKPW